jgi:hypothetical protein
MHLRATGFEKQIISVFEPMYLDILNDDMIGYSNISTRDMMDHLFETYGNITAVDLEINFEHMRRAWDPQHPVESMFKQIQDCADYSEAGGTLIGHSQQINVGYAKIFATGHFMSACSLCHDCSNDGRRPNTLDKPTSPRAGTIQHGWSSGPNQHRSPHLGRGRSNLPDLHLRATGVEEANHQCF